MSHLQVYKGLGLICALILTAFLVYLSLREPADLDERRQARLAHSIESGASLYEIHCRTCHGIKGEGVGQLGPALSDRFFFTERLKEIGWQDTLDSYLKASIAHGRIIATRPKYAGNSTTAVMNPWLDIYGGPLRKDQLEMISQFILNWKPTALGEIQLTPLTILRTSLDDPETIAKGKQVFLDHCRECHSIAGLNTATKKGPDLSSIARIALSRNPESGPQEYIRESFLIPSLYIVKGFEPEILGYRCGGILTARQLDQVTAFLLTLKQ